MAAISLPVVVARDSFSQLAKRSWPSENVGPMVVFVIVGVVAIFLIFLFTYKKIQARKLEKGNSS